MAGEREVFKCNPQRVRRIMQETGWESVFCLQVQSAACAPNNARDRLGERFLRHSQRIRVADGVSDDLRAMRALFFERPEDVKHPTDQRISKKRGGYCYYSATASVRGKTQKVLVRRAGNPHDKRCVELVAPVKLMDRLQIDEGSEVEVALPPSEGRLSREPMHPNGRSNAHAGRVK